MESNVFFFKLLLKTFNNFLKDKCNVSTIFCYFKTEKYMENYLTRTILEKTSPYIKISTREVTTSYFSTFELLTIFEKSKYRDISKLSRNGFRSTKSWKNFLFLYSHFRISCFVFFGTLNIAVSEYHRLCSPRSYNFIHPSNGWVEYSNRIRGKCRKMGGKYDSDYARDIYHSAILLGVASSDK